MNIFLSKLRRFPERVDTGGNVVLDLLTVLLVRLICFFEKLGVVFWKSFVKVMNFS